MCNRYCLEGTFYDIAGNYKATFIGDVDIKGDIFPRSLAPGLLCNLDGERELHAMQFGFGNPNKKGPPFNNTRIETAHEVKLWKAAFRDRRCVLPLSRFYEYGYWGEETAGKQVCFKHKDNELLHVAGIYRTWKYRDGQPPLHAMSFLMAPGSEFILNHGHHRMPLFINEDGIDDWIDPEPREPDELKDRLRQHRLCPDLTFEIVGSMKPAWKDRQAQHLKKRDEQIAAIEACGSGAGF